MMEAVCSTETIVTTYKTTWCHNPNTKIWNYYAVKWVEFLLSISEVPGSNLGPETGYPG
jgi:hypothetical protein